MKRITKLNGTVSEIEEFDKSGNLIFKSDPTGRYWQRWEYDDNGNEIYFEDFMGDWRKREYNQDGYIIKEENPFITKTYEYED